MVSASTISDGRIRFEFDWTCRRCGKTQHEEQVLSDFFADIGPIVPAICDSCGDAIRQEDEKRRFEASWRERSVRDGVPEGFLDYDKGRGNSALFSWIKENWEKSLLIVGNVDTGKSRAMAYAFTRWEAAQKGLKLRFAGWSDFCETYAALSSKNFYEAEEFKKGILGCDILAIDDLGKRRPTPVMEDLAYAVVNSFYESGRRLWITANKPLSSILDAFSSQDIAEAVISRFDRMIKDGKMVRWSELN